MSKINTAEQFRKEWQRNRPNTIHIPSEHELELMEGYASQFKAEQNNMSAVYLLDIIRGECDESEYDAASYRESIKQMIDQFFEHNKFPTHVLSINELKDEGAKKAGYNSWEELFTFLGDTTLRENKNSQFNHAIDEAILLAQKSFLSCVTQPQTPSHPISEIKIKL